MPDIIYFASDKNVFCHVMFNKFEMLALEMLDVRHRAGEQIVHGNNVMTFIQ